MPKLDLSMAEECSMIDTLCMAVEPSSGGGGLISGGARGPGAPDVQDPGPLSLSAFVAVGEQRQDTTRWPTASYRSGAGSARTRRAQAPEPTASHNRLFHNIYQDFFRPPPSPPSETPTKQNNGIAVH
jgi:hypothetical protein